MLEVNWPSNDPWPNYFTPSSPPHVLSVFRINDRLGGRPPVSSRTNDPIKTRGWHSKDFDELHLNHEKHFCVEVKCFVKVKSNIKIGRFDNIWKIQQPCSRTKLKHFQLRSRGEYPLCAPLSENASWAKSKQDMHITQTALQSLNIFSS